MSSNIVWSFRDVIKKKLTLLRTSGTNLIQLKHSGKPFNNNTLLGASPDLTDCVRAQNTAIEHFFHCVIYCLESKVIDFLENPCVLELGAEGQVVTDASVFLLCLHSKMIQYRLMIFLFSLKLWVLLHGIIHCYSLIKKLNFQDKPLTAKIHCCGLSRAIPFDRSKPGHKYLLPMKWACSFDCYFKEYEQLVPL